MFNIQSGPVKLTIFKERNVTSQLLEFRGVLYVTLLVIGFFVKLLLTSIKVCLNHLLTDSYFELNKIISLVPTFVCNSCTFAFLIYQ